MRVNLDLLDKLIDYEIFPYDLSSKHLNSIGEILAQKTGREIIRENIEIHHASKIDSKVNPSEDSYFVFYKKTQEDIDSKKPREMVIFNRPKLE